jgi:ribosomal protein L24
MANLKHVGRLKNNKKRTIVAYRTLPSDPYSCLVVLTESLPSDEHDALIKLVESPAGQQASELAEAMARSYLPDGRNMLAGFHQTGRLKKLRTADVEMTPDTRSVVGLDQLNELIAQQRGIAIEDLAVKPTNQPAATKTQKDTVAEPEIDISINNAHVVLTDEERATQLRGQADKLYKEAKRLRDEAEGLAPTKKKAKSEESV